MKKYNEWIDRKLRIYNPYGQCENWCREMQETFPELKLQRGYYICPFWGKREHWWLIGPDNEIIDPTVSQFPSKGLFGEYENWIEGTKEPTGRCLNCGDYCYDDTIICSPLCKKELQKEFPTLI
jgi:hypothetical protein